MSGFQVGPETFVTVSFQAFDAEGDCASEGEVVAAVFGMGQLLPQVERALEGKAAGSPFELRLAARETFGKRQAEAILEVDRSDFPPDVAAGDRFEVENADGGLLVVHVLEVGEDFVVLDTNHPLADQEVTVRGSVLDVRPATGEEIAAAEAAMSEDEAYLNGAAPDVGVLSLLRPAHRG